IIITIAINPEAPPEFPVPLNSPPNAPCGQLDVA
ncbi:MAG: hypothetical protein RIR96_634, partial [Bacteroidota bacterium]